MSENEQLNKTQVIVAIIGVVGVIMSATIANWDKLFSSPHNTVSTTHSAINIDTPARANTPENTNEALPLPATVDNESHAKLEQNQEPQAKTSPVENPVDLQIMNTSVKRDDKQWAWTIFVQAKPDDLAKIECVKYTLHSTFPDPIQTVCTPENRFALSQQGWGTFNVLVDVIYRNGSVKKYQHMLEFQ